MKWRSIAIQRADNGPRSAGASADLTRAYLNVFNRDDESVEVVLADLANFCGFYKVPPPGTPPDALQYEAGLRAAFGRVFSFLSLSNERLAALEVAAREEAMADQSEGEF